MNAYSYKFIHMSCVLIIISVCAYVEYVMCIHIIYTKLYIYTQLYV